MITEIVSNITTVHDKWNNKTDFSVLILGALLLFKISGYLRSGIFSFVCFSSYLLGKFGCIYLLVIKASPHFAFIYMMTWHEYDNNYSSTKRFCCCCWWNWRSFAMSEVKWLWIALNSKKDNKMKWNNNTLMIHFWISLKLNNSNWRCHITEFHIHIVFFLVLSVSFENTLNENQSSVFINQLYFTKRPTSSCV